MIYYIEKHLPGLISDIGIYDQDGEPVYSLESKLFLGHRKMVLYADELTPMASVVQEMPSIEPRFQVSVDQTMALTVTKRFAFFEPQIDIKLDAEPLHIEGDLINMDFSLVADSGVKLASVHDVSAEEPLYSVEIDDGVDDRLIISLLIIIDHMLNS